MGRCRYRCWRGASPVVSILFLERVRIMSSKHFKALAESLKNIKPETKGAALVVWCWAVEAVADGLKQEPSFDWPSFLEACGY